jgi:predicted nucleic acid-binding protein
VRWLLSVCGRASRLGLLPCIRSTTLWSGGLRPVEIASALARLVRMKQLDPSDWTRARKLAKRLADSWSVIQPSDALRGKSAQLVDRFDLRAADSFQLAAALEWCEDAPQGRVFLTADQKLREAALLSGFDAKQM